MQVMLRVRRRMRSDRERGYIAVLVAILIPVLFGMASFSVDVGNWYSVVQQVQRAADAAALAGVTYLPDNLPAAKAQALATASANGYTNSSTTTVDPEPVAGQPSQLQVTVTTTVDNSFLQILGLDTTTISRTSIATYQAPLAMGSPCNGFGNGPEPTLGAADPRSTNCSKSGQFWANVGAPKAAKSYGDAYQDGNCSSSVSGTSNCAGGVNSDYQNSGYFYSVTLSQAVSNLTIQAFDPAFVSVGDLCSQNFGSGDTAALNAKNHYNYNASTSAARASYLQDPQLYGSGQSNAYCTGDQLYTETGVPPDTTYTIRQPGPQSNPWDPTSYPVVGSCTRTFTGFSGDLYTALNQYQQTKTVVQYSGGAPKLAPAGPNGYQDSVAAEFRQWVTLCTFPGTAPAGTYFVQVQTNAAGDNPQGDGHNRFALRAFGTGAGDNANIAISGYTYMGIYANLDNAQTSFYLTRIQPAAAGQILQVRLFDIGDSSQPGTVTILPPADSNLSSFTNCTGSGPTNGALSNCSITANSSYNGQWESISIPIPVGYTCTSALPTGCWVTLLYNYGSGQPSDTTSWTATLEGTPVRIIK